MICRVCGEPYDLDSLHEEIGQRYYEDHPTASRLPGGTKYHVLFTKAIQEFREKGCEFFTGGRHNDTPSRSRGDLNIIAEVQDLLGDDVDGAQALLEDAGLY